MSGTETIKFVQWAMANHPKFTTDRKTNVLARREWRKLNPKK